MLSAHGGFPYLKMWTNTAADGPWRAPKPARSKAQENTQKTATLHTCLTEHFSNARDARTAASVLCPPTVQKPTAKSFVRFIDTANFIEIWFVNTAQQVGDKLFSNYTNNPVDNLKFCSTVRTFFFVLSIVPRAWGVWCNSAVWDSMPTKYICH